jgi:D-alanyl-D-alanine carboxypeptidase
VACCDPNQNSNSWSLAIIRGNGALRQSCRKTRIGRSSVPVSRMRFLRFGVSRCAPIERPGLRSPLLLLLPTLLLLAACGQQGALPYNQVGPASFGEVPQHYYPPPGPPGDPWGPYIREAAARYNVPEQWIRAVMQQESGGEEQAVSPVGAMGLMQVMPETYEQLRENYGLGNDPYDPHNNIRAGTAYIREMYDEFGSPGFLAGYNAGPDRVESYLSGASRRLPDETVNYIAAISPNLGDAVPPSGPLAMYASAHPTGTTTTGASVASLAAGCDLDAAYDPNHPCTSLERAAAVAAPLQEAYAQQTGANGCDLDAAYDPGHPCTSLPQTAAASASPQPAYVQQAVVQPATVQQIAAAGCDLDAAYDPDHPCRPAPETAPPIRLALNEYCDPNAAYDPDRPCRAAPAASGPELAPARPARVAAAATLARYRPSPHHVPALPVGDWAVQVGAFASPALARAVAEGARRQAPSQLRAATLTLPPTPYRGSVLYRARLAHLSEREAAEACTHLNRRQLPCVVVRPSRS